MALFEAKELHLRFGDRVVLENVSLSFEAGPAVRHHGPERRRQDHLLQCADRPLQARSRAGAVEGRDITGRPPQEIARLGVARSFQLMNLFDEFTVFENVAIALPATRMRGHNAIAKAYADPALVDEAHGILDQVGLLDRADDEARSLPYGARRALEIAVALACRPKLLFLDEPTAGLGSDGRARLADLIRKLKGSLTIVIIEHDMEFLFSLADEISVIHWGQVIARGTPAELKANPWVEASNLGRLN